MKTQIIFLKKNGSAMILTFIFAVVMLIGISSLIGLQFSSNKMTHKTLDFQKARYLADAGVELVLNELNTQDPTDLTTSANYTWTTGLSSYSDWAGKTVYKLTLSNTLISGDSIELEVDNTTITNIAVRSKGTLKSGVFKKIEQIAIKGGDPGPSPVFPGAISSMSEIVIMNSFLVDSYPNGVYNPSKPGYNGHCITTGTNINLKSGSVVRGKLYSTSAFPTFVTGETSNGTVYHEIDHEFKSGVDSDGDGTNDTIGDFDGDGTTGYYIMSGGIPTASMCDVDDRNDPTDPGVNQGGTTPCPYELNFKQPVVPPHLQMRGNTKGTITSGGTYAAGYWDGNTGLGNTTLSGGYYKIEGNFTLGNSKTLTINGDTDIYITGDLDLGNGSTIKNYVVDGGTGRVTTIYWLRLYVDGSITFSQGAEINMGNMDVDYDPKTLQIYGTGLGNTASPADKINMKNGGDFFGIIYAPNYEVELNNGNQIFGAFVVWKIVPKNGAQIHFDERLMDEFGQTPDDDYARGNWKEL